MPLLFSLVLLAAASAALARAGNVSPDGHTPGAGLPYPPAAAPQADEIVHVPTGLAMSFDQMMDMVAGARLVCIGESHDNLRAHQVQLQVIRDLERRYPGRVAIGMEVFRRPQQDALDRWTSGLLDEAAFLEALEWPASMRADYALYRDLLEFARDRRLDVIALNPSRALQDAVGRHGLDALPGELRAQLPGMGPADPYQQAVIKAYFGGHLPTARAFEGFLRVQLLWEESMAEGVVDYLRGERGEGKIMVTLTGTSHVEYGFGVPKKVLRRMPLPYVIISPTEIEIPPDKQMPDVELPDVPLLPADFIWWIPYEELQTGQAGAPDSISAGS